MTEFKYQFQYDPADLKAIRDASGVVRFSPATSISVWASGFAIAILILGAIGAWTVIGALMIAALAFLIIYVNRLNRLGMADREYLVRTVSISDAGVLEEFGNSLFDKSWAAYDKFVEGPNQLLLSHYEKITAIPKRVIPQDELQLCIEFIQSKINSDESLAVDRFNAWFVDHDRFPKYRFRWGDEDVHRLSSERMQLFRSGDASSDSSSQSSPVLATFVVLLAIAALMFYFSRFATVGGNNLITQFVFFAIAICLPFLLALFWWKYTKNAASKKKPNLPDSEIHVTLDEESLLIGYPNAVARYGFRDIISFYHSERFIGFRPVTGMVHVIANHAFGGKPEAMAFLKLADSLRLENATEVGKGEPSKQPVDSGNPFQSPSSG